jgi:hypothetical protein
MGEVMYHSQRGGGGEEICLENFRLFERCERILRLSSSKKVV